MISRIADRLFLFSELEFCVVFIFFIAWGVLSYLGSWQESGKVCVLRGILDGDEFGSRGGQPQRFQ
jgi:hypothetical protein